MFKEYIGDGVYVELDHSNQVVLTTSDGIRTTNTIFMDPSVLRQFRDWMKRNLPNAQS